MPYCYKIRGNIASEAIIFVDFIALTNCVCLVWACGTHVSTSERQILYNKSYRVDTLNHQSLPM